MPENKKTSWVTIRLTQAEKEQIEAAAKADGLDNISAHILQVYRKNRKN